MAQTIASRLTAAAPSAIATIAIHGPRPEQLVATLALRCPRVWHVARIYLLLWPIAEGIQEQVVACLTDEHTLEMHCHGGLAVTNCLLEQLESAGCEIVDAEAFERSILIRNAKSDGGSLNNRNREINLAIRLAADQALLRAGSERVLGYILDQTDGRLARGMKELLAMLNIESVWQTPPKPIDPVCQQRAVRTLEQWSQWYQFGLHLTTPWIVVLAGPPNVGKSSLINALAGQTLAIVHEQAGTTRDWLEASLVVDGWPVNLSDTAGFRPTADAIELQGVERAADRIAVADLVVLVVDVMLGWTSEHDRIVQMCRRRTDSPAILVCGNKDDLLKGCSDTGWLGLPAGSGKEKAVTRTLGVGGWTLPVVLCSATGDVSPLLNQISRLLVPNIPDSDAVVVFDPKWQMALTEIRNLLGQIPVDADSQARLQLSLQQLFPFDAIRSERTF